MLPITTDTIQTLTGEELDQLEAMLIEERDRRFRLPEMEHAQDQVISKLREDGVIATVPVPDNPDSADDFPTWIDPTGHVDKAYQRGDKVFYAGKVWQSKLLQNKFMPGAGDAEDAWVDITSLLFPAVDETGKVAESESIDGQVAPSLPQS